MDAILTGLIGEHAVIVTRAGGAGYRGMIADVTDGVVEMVDGTGSHWFIAVDHVGSVEVSE